MHRAVRQIEKEWLCGTFPDKLHRRLGEGRDDGLLFVLLHPAHDLVVLDERQGWLTIPLQSGLRILGRGFGFRRVFRGVGKGGTEIAL